MKNIRNFFISVAVSVLMLLTLFGAFYLGKVTTNIIAESKEAGEYSEHDIESIMNSPKRNAFLMESVDEYLSLGAYDKLRSFAEEFGLGYSVTKEAGAPVTQFIPFGEKALESEKNPGNVVSFYSKGEESLFVRIYIYYEVDPDYEEEEAFIYDYPVLAFGGLILCIVLFLVSVILLVSIASAIYKVWYFLAFLTGIELLLLRKIEIAFTKPLLWGLGVEKVLLAVLITIYIIHIGRLRKCIQGINSCESSEKILNVKTYPVSLRHFAEDINRTAKSLVDVVEEKTKSERLKTELLSNVSHDIKTPLTSIINFSDLIYNEESENPTITEYAEHLHNQSVRMKELLDELIEAAKASAGAVDIQLVPCNVSTIIEQCVIEYEERLEKRKITLVTESTEQEIYINADVKAMSRVMDNLLVNIVKYGMPGSKAYISAINEEGKCIISVKNSSADPLRISGDELTERFVRGDVSRHSEGHGLGLSIVKSLMDLMNAQLGISVDADVFEAKLIFDVCERND